MSYDHHFAGSCDGISLRREGPSTTIRFRSDDEARAFDRIFRDAIYAHVGDRPAASTDHVVGSEPVCWLYEPKGGGVDFAEQFDEDVYSFPVYRHPPLSLDVVTALKEMVRVFGHGDLSGVEGDAISEAKQVIAALEDVTVVEVSGATKSDQARALATKELATEIYSSRGSNEKVLVTPLIWRTLDNGTAWSNRTPVGLMYHATEYGWQYRNGDINPTDGIEAAKAAAQADYEACIRATLPGGGAAE